MPTAAGPARRPMRSPGSGAPRRAPPPPARRRRPPWRPGCAGSAASAPQGTPAPPSALKPRSTRVRLHDRVDVLLAGQRAAEGPDAVGQLVQLVLLDERQRLPDRVAGQPVGEHVVAV